MTLSGEEPRGLRDVRGAYALALHPIPIPPSPGPPPALFPSRLPPSLSLRLQAMAPTATPPGLTEATRNSTTHWQHDLQALFDHAKDRFADVVWELNSDSGSGVEEVWGHKGVFSLPLFSFAPSPRVVLSINPCMSTRACLLFLRARSVRRSCYGLWLLELSVVEQCVLRSTVSSSLPCMFNTILSFVHAAFRCPVRLTLVLAFASNLWTPPPHSPVVVVPRCLDHAHPHMYDECKRTPRACSSLHRLRSRRLLIGQGTRGTLPCEQTRVQSTLRASHRPRRAARSRLPSWPK